MAPKTLRLCAAVVALVIGSFMAGFAIGQHINDRRMASPKPDTENRNYPVYFEEDLLGFSFVQDALDRWATKNRMTVEETLGRDAPQAMGFPRPILRSVRAKAFGSWGRSTRLLLRCWIVWMAYNPTRFRAERTRRVSETMSAFHPRRTVRLAPNTVR
jgi:hypothetical protein